MRLPMDHSSATDEELMKAFQFGDDQAFEVLWSRYRKRVHAFLRITKSQRFTSSDIDDMTEEVFLKVIRAKDQFDCQKASASGNAFEVWLFSIARNGSRDVFRKLRRWLPTVALDHGESEDEQPIRSRIADPSEQIEQQICRNMPLRHALAELSTRQREILIFKYWLGFTDPEVAQQLSISKGNVAKAGSEARAKLQKILHAKGITSSLTTESIVPEARQ